MGWQVLGASRSVKNEKVHFSSNPKTVRVVRNWFQQYLGRKRHSGLRLMLKPDEVERVMTLCDDLDRAKYGHN